MPNCTEHEHCDRVCANCDDYYMTTSAPPAQAGITREKPRYDYLEAYNVATYLKARIAPYVERIEIAGSLRRKAATMGDIELLVQPYDGPHPKTGFWTGLGTLSFVLSILLTDEANSELYGRYPKRRKPGQEPILALRRNAKGQKTFGRWNKLLVHLPTGIPVDLFTAFKENWGMAMFIRTGPKEWNIKAMLRLRALGLQGKPYGGVIDAQGIEHACPKEEDVFATMGWQYRKPEDRNEVNAW